MLTIEAYVHGSAIMWPSAEASVPGGAADGRARGHPWQRPAASRAVLGVYTGTLFASYVLTARALGIPPGRTDTVTVIQCFAAVSN